MAKNLFSVSIFFIVFRESLEAVIIVSVLLGLVEQLVKTGGTSSHNPSTLVGTHEKDVTKDGSETPKSEGDVPVLENEVSETESDEANNQRLIRKMRLQIFAGAGLGLFFALAIGAAFIAVFYTQASNLWMKSEALWEGIFSLVASLLILVMGLGVLRIDRAKAKWRVKIRRSFDGTARDSTSRAGRWALFILPFITVLREGLEAVVFVGGVSLGQPASSIPIATIVGLICGFIIGFVIYAFASRTQLRVFMIVLTNFLLLIGAGLFSKATWAFQEYKFNQLLGADLDDAGGDGPGSFDVVGNVWHLNCCNPENKTSNTGWSLFSALFGWQNSATLGSILAYVFYWVLVIGILVTMKMREGRAGFGKRSVALPQ